MFCVSVVRFDWLTFVEKAVGTFKRKIMQVLGVVPRMIRTFSREDFECLRIRFDGVLPPYNLVNASSNKVF